MNIKKENWSLEKSIWMPWEKIKSNSLATMDCINLFLHQKKIVTSYSGTRYEWSEMSENNIFSKMEI